MAAKTVAASQRVRQKSIPGSPMSTDEARVTAKEAYVYGYAPVYIERQRRNMVSVDKDMGDGRAPENTFSWVRNLVSPEIKVIVMPNNDTLYGSAWIDLNKGPFLLEVPDMGDRYFCFQFMDVFSNTFDYIGSRATGSKGGKFAIVGPNRAGKMPAGLAGTINAPTSTIWLVSRIAIAGASELDTVHKLQDSIHLTALNGKSAAMPNPHYAPLPPPEKLPALTFFQILGDLLKDYPTPQPAGPLVSKFAVINLTPGSGFDAAALSPELKNVLEAGAKDAFAAIEEAKLGSSVNGWDFSMKNGKFGEDYLLRSVIAYRSLAGNTPEEAIYFNANKDLDGQPLDGAYRYEMRFPKGQLPPVGAFWSLTMYDGKDFLLVENPIHRYAVSDRTQGLKYADDGSLTIYIQHESPGPDKESNWLPAPAGIFDVHLRTYVPKPVLLNGEYKLPPLKRIDGNSASIGFDHGLPTPATRQKLYDEMDLQRASQAVIWAEPAVNNALFLRAMQRVVVPNLGAMLYDQRMQPGQEVLTPNQSVVYLYDSINLKNTGPVVHIVPPAPINAGFFDMWMRPVYDFGTVGPNKGKGDRILLLPPDYKGEVPTGYQIVRPKTYQIFTITRIAITKDMTAEQATAIMRKIQTYPLSQAANPPAKVFVLMGDPARGGKELRMNRPWGLDYWRLVHDIIDSETTEDRDRIMLGSLDSIGISKGEPFNPDLRMQRILVEAYSTGLAMMINEAFSPRTVPKGVTKELYAGTHWENIQLLPSMTQEAPYFTYVTGRMIGFYQANGAQFAWDPRDYPPGFGQKYAAAYMDGKGEWLKGEKTYKLQVPANVPVKDFWSVAVYDVDTRALIETDQHLAEINPNVAKLEQNPDGSVDLFFGPSAPPVGKESNWVRTIPGKAWFVYFRWYGPLEAYYNKSWKLPDISLNQE